MADHTVVTSYDVPTDVGSVSHFTVATDYCWTLYHCSVFNDSTCSNYDWFFLIDVGTSDNSVLGLRPMLFLCCVMALPNIWFNIVQGFPSVALSEQLLVLVALQILKEAFLEKETLRICFMCSCCWFHQWLYNSSH